MFTDYWKVLVLSFLEMGNIVFFEPKSWWNDDIYWLLENSCSEPSRYGKYGYFWAKKLMGRWYLLITGKFLFWTFRRREIQSFLTQKVDRKMIFTDYWKVLVFKFPEIGNSVFFEILKFSLVLIHISYVFTTSSWMATWKASLLWCLLLINK